MRQTRVLIIDDHELVRAALLEALAREADLQVRATAASTDPELLEALRFEPDVVLIDVKRVHGNGVEICRKIIREQPSSRVLVLTSYADEREEGEIQAMGAVGYLLKNLNFQELLHQIKVAPTRRGHGNPVGG